jgi:hypothetical protein
MLNVLSAQSAGNPVIHVHNDYLQLRSLFDALDQGFDNARTDGL